MSNPEDQKEESVTESVEVGNDESIPSEVMEELIQEDTAESNDASAEDTTSDANADESVAVPVTVESLQAELEKASIEVTNFKDVALRAEAEVQNMRRRASKDLENAHKFGLDKFVQNLLPVIDSLEKAVESTEHAADAEMSKAIVDGVGLCHKMLLDVLEKENVAVVDPMGEPFDPNFHQAMSMVENPEVEPNSVVTVIQKGYTLNTRLVRPAMVMVSKGVSPQIDEKA